MNEGQKSHTYSYLYLLALHKLVQNSKSAMNLVQIASNLVVKQLSTMSINISGNPLKPLLLILLLLLLILTLEMSTAKSVRTQSIHLRLSIKE